MRNLVRKCIYKATYASVAVSGPLMEIMSDKHLERNVYSEPFDFPDHVGNFTEGSIATFAVYGAAILVSDPLFDKKSAEDLRQRRVIAAAGLSFLTSSLVQIVGEKYGLSSSAGENGKPIPNIPDAIDALYGIAWSAVVASTAMVCSLRQIGIGRQPINPPVYTDQLSRV